MSIDELAWVPDSCALPTVERPLRAAEFDDLFRLSLQGQQRLTPTRLRWIFEPEAEAQVRDLVRRETSCCSFFTFSVIRTGHGVVVEAEVPDAHTAVLDGLQARAAADLSSEGDVRRTGTP